MNYGDSRNQKPKKTNIIDVLLPKSSLPRYIRSFQLEYNTCQQQSRKLQATLDDTLAGKGEDGALLLKRFQEVSTKNQAAQQRRTWAGDVYNAFFSSENGVRRQLLDFEEFMETQQEAVETPELRAVLIRSNYMGNLEYTLSKLPPLEQETRNSGTDTPELPLLESQLDFLGWKSIWPVLREIRELIDGFDREIELCKQSKQKRKSWPEEKWCKEQVNSVAELCNRADRQYQENISALERISAEAEPYNIDREKALYAAMTQLAASAEFLALRKERTDPEEQERIVEDSWTFLRKAHELLLDKAESFRQTNP